MVKLLKICNYLFSHVNISVIISIMSHSSVFHVIFVIIVHFVVHVYNHVMSKNITLC